MRDSEKAGGRPRKEEIKDPISLRIYPTKRLKLARVYGTIQQFFDKAVDEEVEEIEKGEIESAERESWEG